MSVYLDASVLLPLFAKDAFSPRADAFLANVDQPLIVSDFAAAEFASGLSRFIRMRLLAMNTAQTGLADFDDWRASQTTPCETTTRDVDRAGAYLRRLDLPLRTPDALHLALAERAGAPLATFDLDMARSARVLGLSVAEI